MPTPLRNAWRKPRNLPLAKLAPGYVADVSDVPFRTSIAPSVGTTPTLTRALAATVVDHEGIVRTAKSGELRFSGLRRVENLFTATSSLGSACFNNGIGGFFNVTQNIKLSKNGEMVGCRYIATASTTQGLFSRATPPASLTAGTYLVFVDVFIPSQPGVYNWSINFDFGDVEVGTSATQTTFDAWVTAWAVVTISATRSFVDFNVRYNGSTIPSGSGFELYACYAQLENVTGQAVQTPGEYVSNGVLSAPWHGAGVDGVKYFNTNFFGFSLNPLTTNAIRNNTMAGAAAPATLPANWQGSTIAGLTFSVLGSGVEDDIKYIDVRWVGTTSAAGGIGLFFEPANSVAAAIGQTWTHSAFVRLLAGSPTNSNLGIGVNELNAGGTYLAGTSLGIAPDTRPLAQSRVFHTRVFSNAAAAYAHPYIYGDVSSGVAIDVTLRIGMPQLQKLEYPTPVIPTAGAAASAAIAGFPRCFVEPSRINVVLNAVASCAGSSTTAAVGTAISPSGELATKVIPNAGAVSYPGSGNSAVQTFANSQSVGQSTDYVFSGYFAAIGPLNYQPYIVITADTNPGNELYALVFFNAQAGTFSGKTLGAGWSELAAPSAVIAVGGMWFVKWRLRYTQQALLRTRISHYLQIANQSATTVYTADGSSGIQRAMHQFEVGPDRSSYIPTGGAAVTRPVDTLAHNLTLGNTGTWVVTLSPAEVPASAGLYPMVSLQATAGNLIGLFMQPALTTVSLTVYANGVQTISGSIQSSVVAGGVYRVALSWSAANRRINYCVNGGTPGAVTGVDMPQALTSFSTAASNPWIGTVSDSEIFAVEHPPETLKLMSAL